MKIMKGKDNKEGFPQEFAIYIPLMDEKEKKILLEKEKSFSRNDSLIKVRDFIVDLLPTLSKPSDIFLFSLGKILYYIADYETLLSYQDQYVSTGIELWGIRVLLERELNDEAIKLASKIKEKVNLPIFYNLHSLRSIARGYLNLGNYEQCKIHLTELFEKTVDYQKLPKKEKNILNDSLLDGHRDNFFLNRYVEEKIKLENNLNIALHIAEELEERNKIALFNYLMALLQRDAGKIEDSLRHTNYAIKILEETGNISLLAASKGNLGTINVILGDLKKAEKIYEEILDSFQYLGENRYIVLSIKCLGDLAISRGKFEEAIKKYEEALSIVEKLNMKEPYQYCVLAELYLQSNKMNEYQLIDRTLQEDLRANPSPAIESYLLFLRGMFNIEKMNYGKAEELLSKALIIADRQGRGELSAKILMNKVLLNLKKYDVDKVSNLLDDALSDLEQLLPYFVENKLYKEHIAIHLLQSKIYAIQKEFSEAFNTLQHAKDILIQQKDKRMLQIVNERIEQINLLFPEEKEHEIAWVHDAFRKEISGLEEFGLRYMQRSHVEIDVSPLALIVLHKSGIPLRSYVISKKTVKDQLLFGGFILAIKDMLSELFQEQKSQMLVITYGNYKIISQAHFKGFSSVAVSAFDSFSLRRKIHQLTDKLSALELPDHFYGELSDNLAKEIDDEVNFLFGTALEYSDDLKVDV